MKALDALIFLLLFCCIATNVVVASTDSSIMGEENPNAKTIRGLGALIENQQASTSLRMLMESMEGNAGMSNMMGINDMDGMQMGMISGMGMTGMVKRPQMMMGASGGSSSMGGRGMRGAAGMTVNMMRRPRPKMARPPATGTTNPPLAIACPGSILLGVQTFPELSTLELLLTRTGLDRTLAGGSFTVLAPNNEAFRDLPSSVAGRFADDMDALTSDLLYHVIEGAVNADDLAEGQVIETVQGSTITVTGTSPRVEFNGNADVVSADIGCDNGVIHVIDTVLIPPAMGMTNPPLEIGCPGSILDGVQTFPELSTLETLLIRANLARTLAGGSFTVLAPNNKAFLDLPSSVANELADDFDALTNVLLYHVIDGAVNSADLIEGQVIEALQGSTITVTGISPRVEFNEDVHVVSADIGCDNGIVHIIDTVLIPPP